MVQLLGDFFLTDLAITQSGRMLRHVSNQEWFWLSSGEVFLVRFAYFGVGLWVLLICFAFFLFSCRLKFEVLYAGCDHYAIF